MAKKIIPIKEATEVKKSAIDYRLVSKVMTFWGVATALQGVLITYSMAAQLISAASSGTNLLSFLALPYELNAVAGIFNLFFGIALIALGHKIKTW